MLSGIPLAKLDDDVADFKRLMEKAVGGPISVSHLREIIPDIRAHEVEKIKTELKGAGSFVSIIFDGTTDVCEIAAVIARWTDKQFRPHQRLLAASFIEGSMNGRQLSAYLVHILFTRYGLDPNRIFAFVRDGAYVNNVATRTMMQFCTNAIDSTCASHTACLAGNNLSRVALPLASEFISKWSQMMSQSNIARQEWKELVGKSAKTKSMVRWGSEYSVARDIMINFGSVEDLIGIDREFAANLRQDLRRILSVDVVNENGLSSKDSFRLELAAFNDIGEHIFSFVYDYEGDGFLSPFVYDKMVSVQTELTSIVINHDEMKCRNIMAVARQIAGDNEARKAHLIQMACDKGAAARDKFIDKFSNPNGSCFRVMQIYKGLTLLQPKYMRSLPQAEIRARIHTLCQHVPLFSQIPNFEQRLTDESVRYIELANQHRFDGTDPHELAHWWTLMRGDLPEWSIVVSCAVLLVPSSAGAERVFSMITSMFDDDQDGALEDYKEASLMLRYNTIWRNKYL